MSKKKQKIQSKFPIIEDENHIYNVLIENGIKGVDTGAHYYVFELHSNLIEEGEKVDGLTTFTPEKSIKLEASLNDEDARETIFHEILHAIMHQAGLEEYNFDGEFIKITNEAFVTILSKSFRQFNRLNPNLISILCSLQK